MVNICNYCRKSYSTKSVLNTHLKICKFKDNNDSKEIVRTPKIKPDRKLVPRHTDFKFYAACKKFPYGTRCGVTTHEQKCDECKRINTKLSRIKAEEEKLLAALSKKIVEEPKTVEKPKIIEVTKEDTTDDDVEFVEEVPHNHPDYIYLIHPAKHYETKTNIYKVGRTIQLNQKRFNAYPRGSQLLYQNFCNDCVATETKILEIFTLVFGKPVQGREYFQGNPKNMRKIIETCIDSENECVIKPIAETKANQINIHLNSSFT